MSARSFFIAAAVCVVLNLTLIWLPGNVFPALGALALILAVVLLGYGLRVRRQLRRSAE